MYQAGAFPRLPFYDTRLADFFATVPTAFVKGRRLQIDYLKRFAPDLARIKWQAYDTNLYRYPLLRLLAAAESRGQEGDARACGASRLRSATGRSSF